MAVIILMILALNSHFFFISEKKIRQQIILEFKKNPKVQKYFAENFIYFYFAFYLMAFSILCSFGYIFYQSILNFF